MTPRQRRSSAVDRSTIAFLCGLCGVEELPGSFLIEVFGALGMSISGARSYLARAVADGRLASHRHGRQTLYSLNGTLLRRYRTVRRASGEMEQTMRKRPCHRGAPLPSRRTVRWLG